MMDFLKTLCTAAAFLSLALLFIPERAGMRRASITVLSLLFLLFLIPKDGSFDLSSLLSFEKEVEYPAGDAYTETLEKAIKDGIQKDVCSRFALSSDAVLLDTDLTLADGRLTGSYLFLSLGKENFFADATGVLSYLEKTYGVDCEVYFYGN